MTLEQYLKNTNQSQRRFARTVGVSQTHIRKIIQGYGFSQELANRISAATRYEVVLVSTSRGRGKITDIKRLQRIITAKHAGVSYDDIAERFGLKNRNCAKGSYYYAKKILARRTYKIARDRLLQATAELLDRNIWQSLYVNTCAPQEKLNRGSQVRSASLYL